MHDDKLEKYVLLIFLIHNIAMFVGAISNNWSSWVASVFLLAGIFNAVIVFGKYWDFNNRAVFITITINVCLAIYGCKSESVNDIIVPFLGVTVLLGLYGLQKLMIISLTTISFIIFYHWFIIHSFSINSTETIYKYGMPFLNAYFIIFILYFWNVKRNESAKMMSSVISELKIAEQGKDDFLANVSHEIRTPVNTVVGMSEVILREVLDEKVKEDVLNIQTSGRQLVSIVSDILDFSELQSGKMKLIEVEYNINTTIQDIISMSLAMGINKNVDFIVDCDGSIPNILIGDEQKIRRMVLNLISNAIKFTNEGCVVLSFEYRKEKYGINLLISVRDTGIGIDKKNIERLFTTYNQVDSKRNRQESGIGLGLAIVKAIVEVMGGVISVKSELQKGSEFKVVIPQKVKDYEPMVKPMVEENYHLLSFFDVEQFDFVLTREAFYKQIKKIADDFDMQIHMCHNMAELKRRIERDTSSTVLIGIYEYLQDKAYFNEISEKMNVVVILDRKDSKEIVVSNIIKVYKPIFVGTFLDCINMQSNLKKEKFIAPEAEVLVVDDNMINLKVISGLLEPYKMKVTLSNSGADALERIDKKQFDIIFMDHMMPEMDGIETLNRIRNKVGVYYKEVPIIALTANSVAGAREMFLEKGFQEFVSKPIELGILERVLRMYIPSGKIIYEESDFEITELEQDMAVVKTSSENESAGDNKLGGLEEFDVDQGITFCGTYENFLSILQIHGDEGKENYRKINEFFERRDWKNYTILVHGLKSSMKSVGANILSEKARLLESASKSEDEEYILGHHEDMMNEYNKIINSIINYFGKDNDKKEDTSLLPELSDESFEVFLTEFENASYSFDEIKIRNLISKIEGYRYREYSLKDIINTINNKVEMSDYISAFEAIKRWKDKIDRKA